ncbi:tRNA lysidine(34) synthetase TilS [Pseudoxanthomonas taiwanensis]|uniref:tRNA(Ile)-lysidine synthase n=1 Tax=Pseudoxanthomonas taiwanensis TaxID=176598 RepID=A0A921P2S1_9GAMM|nr:tRNA lysidine(34) synthetase TilS [Pseudoxanthomonas taiwanensis]KAF1690418.1 tRNA lysidine(34) synthetase TilS [Pseudoxanthomonas taiwanensis]
MDDTAPPAPALPLDLPAQATGAFVAACSGGLDSVVLLHRLAAEPAVRARGLRAVHVHHGLQAGADAWADHCRQLADALQVPLQVERVQVPRDSGLGLEAAARQARYEALARALAPGEVLATAHHQDDQAETFLLRALRASGPEGLGAMRPLRRFAGGWHWRPLLEVPRATLEAYARAHGLAWVEDPSNALADPDRNFLRLQVLPLLRRRWPHAAAALSRSAALSAAADALLKAGDQALLPAVAGTGPGTLSVRALLAQPPARRARLLRLRGRARGLPPLPARGLERIEADLLHARADAQPCFDWAGARVQRWRDLLHAGPLRAPLPEDWHTDWDGRAPLDLPDGGRLWLEGDAAAAGFDAPLRVRARRGGERIRRPGRAPGRALKHVLQERGVPPWRRAHLPLLADAAGRILAAGDVAVATELAAWLAARGLRLAWCAPGDAPCLDPPPAGAA